jgi:hypothetical protein
MDFLDRQSQLKALALRVEAYGFVCKMYSWGGRPAVSAWTQPKEAEDGLKYMDGALVAYPIEGGWEAITRLEYGGPDWVAHCETLDALIPAIVSALSHPRDPLTAPWSLKEG